MQKSLLLVDDDHAVREMFATGLAIAGFKIASVGSGELALARLQNESFDITLLDMMMPSMSGLDMLVKANELQLLKNMGRIVAFTSLDKNLLQEKLRVYNVTKCLDKSNLTPTELATLLKD